MNITQTFYDSLASQYDKLFSDWDSAIYEQADILDRLFKDCGFDKTASVLDCACGIGTQAIGLATLGYNIAASDISDCEIKEANKRALSKDVTIRFENADFRALSKTFTEKFDIIIAMDNALPHMLSNEDLGNAVKSISNQIKEDGIFIGSIRDYDSILKEKPPYSPPYIHKNQNGQRVCFQTWEWNGDIYKLTQYIIEDGDDLKTSKFECEYRAVCRSELSELFASNGFKNVVWKFTNETGFYQPIIIARK